MAGIRGIRTLAAENLVWIIKKWMSAIT